MWMRNNLRSRSSVFVVLLLLLPFALYVRYLHNPLVFDDLSIFTDQILYQAGHSGFYFTSRWLPYASFGWTYTLVGSDWIWYRLTNVLLHAVTALLVYLFFSRLFSAVWAKHGVDVPISRANWFAFAGASLFAIHPVAVYAVAYLVERSIILATLFSVAFLVAYLEGLRRSQGRWFFLAAVFYFLAVFSKEHSILVPALALGLTFLLQPFNKQTLRLLAGPFILYGLIGVYILLQAKGVLGGHYEPYAKDMLSSLSEGQSEIQIEHAYGLSVITQGYLFFKYLALWIFPNPSWMAIDLRPAFATTWFTWPHTFGFAAFIVWPLLCLRLMRGSAERTLAGFGLLFPWVLFLVEFSTVRLQEPFVLYRSYLWMVGLVACVPWLALKLKRPVIQFSVWAVIGVTFAAISVNRLETFRSDLALWNDAIRAFKPGPAVLGAERLYANRGYAYAQLGDDELALKDYAEALQINPRYRGALANQAMALSRKGDFETAVQNFDTYIALNPTRPAGYIGRGSIRAKQKQYDAALADFTKAIEINPEVADGYLNRANVEMNLGRTQEAMNDLDEAQRLNPLAAETYANRGRLSLQLGRLGDAERDLDHALKLNPKSATGLTNRALLYAATDKLNAAKTDLDRVIEMYPRDAHAYFNRGNVYVGLRQTAQALADYDKALALAPNFTDARNNRGALHMMLGDMQSALNDFDIAIKSNSQNIDTYLNRGGVLINLGRYKEAVSDFDSALKLQNDARAYLGRGIARLGLNDKKTALSDLRKSCDMGAKGACAKLQELGAS